MKLNLMLLCALILVLTGCGSKSEKPKVSGTSQFKIVEKLPSTSELSMLKEAMDRQVVVCGEAGLSCPSHSAKLTFWGVTDSNDDFYIGVCSGTLYNGKYIITNSHCIPREISRAGANCTDQLKVLFPTTKYNNSESAKCKNIVQVYDPSKDQPDIAVIELDRFVTRDSVEIARDGFVEGGSVFAYTMNPHETDKTLGTLIKKTCTLSTDNAVFASTSQAYGTALISGSACEIISGNSGSALLNKNGKLIGAVFARLDIPGLTSMMSKSNINFTSKTPMGMVQNITCLTNITTSSGVNCSLASPAEQDFHSYVERAKEEQNLRGVNDTQIEYELTTNLKLKLKEVAIPATGKELTSFRQNWINVFFKSGQARASRILSKFSKLPYKTGDE